MNGTMPSGVVEPVLVSRCYCCNGFMNVQTEDNAALHQPAQRIGSSLVLKKK